MIRDILKTAVMSALQQQVAEKGVCPNCHTKTLRVAHEAVGYSFEQCTNCLKVYVLPCGVA